MSQRTVKALVAGGKATGGPPLGPALAPLGVNVLAVVEKINEETKDFLGMRVPVTVIVDTETKDFWVEVGTPTVSALVAKEISKEKGSATAGKDFIGNLSMEQVVKIAKAKRGQMLAKTLRGAVGEVVGACVSMGVTVESEDPKQAARAIKQGKYDNVLGEG